MKNLSAMEIKFFEAITYFREHDRAGLLAVDGLINVCLMEQGKKKEDLYEDDFAVASKGELKRAIRRLRQIESMTAEHDTKINKTIDYIRREHLSRFHKAV